MWGHGKADPPPPTSSSPPFRGLRWPSILAPREERETRERGIEREKRVEVEKLRLTCAAYCYYFFLSKMPPKYHVGQNRLQNHLRS